MEYFNIQSQVMTSRRRKAFFLSSLLLLTLIFHAKNEKDWQRLCPPIQDNIHDIFLLNDLMGWAYTYGTGVIIKTADGGKSWEVIAKLDPVYFEQIQFLDPNHGWICGGSEKVYSTSDGGKTWINKGFEALNSQFYFYAMHFFDVNTGFIGGMKIDSDGKKEYVLFKTENGGNSWRTIKSNPRSFLTSIVFLNNSIGYASGQNCIYKTDSGGETWQTIYKGPRDGRKEGFRDLFFFNKDRGFAVNAGGEILRTVDGGNSWQVLKVADSRLRSIKFVNEEVGYVVGDNLDNTGAIYCSIDRGLTWSVLNKDYPDLHRIKRSENYIWVVGKKGVLLKKKIH
jgi:photosystem II stability/assembly factor-like uncharacterized protein